MQERKMIMIHKDVYMSNIDWHGLDSLNINDV